VKKAILAVFGAAAISAFAPGAEPPATVLEHAGVIDGSGAPARSGQTIVVEGGRISSVAPDGRAEVPRGAEVLDLSGKFVVPGLVDAHVHLTGAESDLDGYRTLLRELLLSGVTTVRDMAGDDRLLAYLSREAASGTIAGPDIFYAALLSGPSFFAEDGRAQAASEGLVLGQAPYMQAVTAKTDLALAVAEAKGTGASGIKLYANLPAVLVKDLAAEAHRQGMLVWTHATIFPAKPSEAVAAGADSLSHSAYLVWEAERRVPEDYRVRARGNYRGISPKDPRILAVLDAMRTNGAILDATLFPFVEEEKREPEKVGAGIGEWSAAVTRLARERGVLVDAGSDSAGLPLDENGRVKPGAAPNVISEMGLLAARSGFSPLEAIRAATWIGAMAAGQSAERGTIAAGKRADLLVLDADPLADLGNLRRVAFVMKAGRIFRKPAADVGR
jgi:imidazolonepropionase-like amidohydrolase